MGAAHGLVLCQGSVVQADRRRCHTAAAHLPAHCQPVSPGIPSLQPPTRPTNHPQSCRMAHLDRPYGDWPQAVTSIPADAMGLRQHGRIGAGLPANLVVFRGRRYSELLSRPQYDRVRPVWVACCIPVCGSWLLGLPRLTSSCLHCLLEASACRPPTQPPNQTHPPCHSSDYHPQVVVRDGRPLFLSPPSYEELDYVPAAIKSGEVPVLSIGFEEDGKVIATATIGAPLGHGKSDSTLRSLNSSRTPSSGPVLALPLGLGGGGGGRALMPLLLLSCLMAALAAVAGGFQGALARALDLPWLSS